MGKNLNRSKRAAAGHCCLTLFGVMNTVTHGLAILTREDYEGLGSGLTDKEKEFVRKLASDFHRQGETLRKLGWRFHGR